MNIPTTFPARERISLSPEQAAAERRLTLAMRARSKFEQPHHPLSDVYLNPLGALTDDYQIAMAYAHWKKGNTKKKGVFHYYFRSTPFKSGYAIASGLTHFVDFVTHYRWPEHRLERLAKKTGNDGKPLYPAAFIDYLRNLKLTVDVDAVPEGTVVFANEPVIRVSGPIIQGHLLESALLNECNFLTLCATKASRIVYAANGKPVSDQSLRRDQGTDGSFSACWATFVGGFTSTSNFEAAAIFGVESKGTMAHAWIMAHVDELGSFDDYADALPNNCVFLVDTYSSEMGIENAIKAGLKLRERGHEMIGIRLDSGDLAYLSKLARKRLDEAGFPNAKVFVSNDLDEHTIKSLNEQGARIDVYGVGTKVGTCYDQPALGGVFKLGAYMEDGSDVWVFPIKLSEQMIKVSTPGIQQIRRFTDNGKFIADMIFNEETPPKRTSTLIDPLNEGRQRTFGKGHEYIDLLVPIFRNGICIYQCPHLMEIQKYAAEQQAALDPAHRRFDNPHEFPVGLEKALYQLKKKLIREASKKAKADLKKTQKS